MQLLAPSEERSRLLTAGAVLTGFAAVVGLLYYGRVLCITLVISVILAFMLEPFVGLLIRVKFPRTVASFIVCGSAVVLLYLVGASLFAQLLTFSDELPQYSQRVNQLVDNVAARLEKTEKDLYKLIVPRRFQDIQPVPEPPPPPKTRRRTTQPVLPTPQPPQVQEVRIREERSSLAWIAGYVSSFYQVLLMASFVPFLVYFMLSWRDHLHRSILALYGKRQSQAGRSLQAIAGIARAYVVGNVILGVLISVVSCAVFWSWHLPYWVLLGFVSGFLSLIPYVGLPLAIIPPFAATLMVYNTVGPFVLISAEVALIHLLALNLLYPAIVGARVHLNPLVVTVALMFWGTLWGGVGLVLAIPITAAIKAVFDNTENLQEYGRLLGD